MSTSHAHRIAKLGLIVGGFALVVAIAIAHRTPTTGYELSLYQSTPIGVWLGIGVAALLGTVIAIHAQGRVRDAALILAGASTLAVYALPIIRGYFFYGLGDSLSHLGYAREIVGGQVDPTNLLYPTIHVGTVSIAAVGGVSISLALLHLVLVVFPLLFLVFVPLCVKLLTGSPHGFTVGILAAMLFAPINLVSVHPIAHPASQAILFAPVVLFVVLRYVTNARDGRVRPLPGVRTDGSGRRRWATPIGLLLVLISATVVLNHPQQAVNVILLFAAVSFTQAVYRSRRPNHPISGHRPLYVQTSILVVLFLLWTPRFPIVGGAIEAFIGRMFGGSPPAGEVVATKSQSIVAIGGDVPILFLRLFLPAAVLSLLAGILILGVIRSDLFGRTARADGLLVYLTVALVPLVGVFVLFVAFGYDDMFFRYHGFIMVPVTILGAVALTTVTRMGARWPSQSRRWLVAGLFVLLLPVAAMAFHPSPHIYQPTPHVAESQVNGYEASFDHRLPEQEFVGLRGGPRRYVDAVHGTSQAESTLDFPGYRDELPASVFNLGNYSTYFEEDRYLAMSPAESEREVDLYGGFRYSDQGFSKLSSTPGVARLRASDGFQLYYVEAEEG